MTRAPTRHPSPRTVPGRGRSYSRLRGALESALRRFYRGGWPGRIWGRLPVSRQVHLIELTLPILPRGLPPLTLAFASDLHLGPTTATSTLERARDILRSARPDVLLLGGDYVFLEATPPVADELARWVEDIGAKTSIAVLGNHDLWTDHGLLEESLAAAGAEVLVNGSIALPPPHREVVVVGLDDPATGRRDIGRAFSGVEDARLKIVLCHSSDELAEVRERGARLLLVGHTHGGHIALPTSIPLIVPGRFGRRYPFGFHDVDGLGLFVSRGIGGVELPIRTFAPPDVAVIELTPRR